jgi:hypothetical protein
VLAGRTKWRWKLRADATHGAWRRSTNVHNKSVSTFAPRCSVALLIAASMGGCSSTQGGEPDVAVDDAIIHIATPTPPSTLCKGRLLLNERRTLSSALVGDSIAMRTETTTGNCAGAKVRYYVRPVDGSNQTAGPTITVQPWSTSLGATWNLAALPPGRYRVFVGIWTAGRTSDTIFFSDPRFVDVASCGGLTYCDVADHGAGRCIDSQTDADNCNGCGLVCSSNNVVRDCQSGSCAGGTCNLPFNDCDDDKTTNGCESNSQTDNSNCGACGTTCGAATCKSGACCLSGVTFDATGGIQTITVASTGTYTIEVAGAQGSSTPLGGYQGGLGAIVKGDFVLAAGTTLQLVVGARPSGPAGNYDVGGGGGGSFVYASATDFPLPAEPLLVAGGGGGGGGAGGSIASGSGAGGAAGTTGGGGPGGGGGGAGWLGSGDAGTMCCGQGTGARGGQQWGGGGGINYSGNPGANGGFGGGGGSSIVSGAGGGGGYSGGRGGDFGGAWPEGGTSFFGATAIAETTTATAGARSGHGFVTITGPLSVTCP